MKMGGVKLKYARVPQSKVGEFKFPATEKKLPAAKKGLARIRETIPEFQSPTLPRGIQTYFNSTPPNFNMNCIPEAVMDSVNTENCEEKKEGPDCEDTSNYPMNCGTWPARFKMQLNKRVLAAPFSGFLVDLEVFRLQNRIFHDKLA